MTKSLLKNVYINTVLSKVYIIVVTFLGTVIISRFLGAELKGQYTYILNSVLLLSQLLSLGVGQAYSFFFKRDGFETQQSFINLFYMQLGLYVVVALILSRYFENSYLYITSIVSIGVVFNNQLSFMTLITNVEKRNRTLIISNTVYFTSLLIVYLMFEKNLYLILGIYAIKVVISIVINIVRDKLYYRNLDVDLTFIFEVVKFGFFPMVTSLLITCNYNLDVLILKKYVSYSNIGVYSIAVGLATLLWLVPDAFKEVLFNKTARSNAQNDIINSLKFNIYFSIFVIIGFAIFGKKFIELAFGYEFIDAYSVTLLLFCGSIPMIFFKIINTLYISIGKQKFALSILSISVSLNIISNFFLVTKFNILGAAVSSVFSYTLCGFIFLINYMKEYDIYISEIFILKSTDIDFIGHQFKRLKSRI